MLRGVFPGTASWTISLALMALVTEAQAQRGGGDSTYRDHLTAAQASDPARAYLHLLRALELTNGHPDVLYLLARNALRRGQSDSAVGRLRTIAAMGLSYEIDRDTALAILRGRDDFGAVLMAMTANRAPIGGAATAATMDDPDLLTEDVAYDPLERTFYISCIHKQRIIALLPSGATTTFAVADGDTLLTPVALVVDSRRRALWATTASMPQAEHCGRRTPGGAAFCDTTWRRIGSRPATCFRSTGRRTYWATWQLNAAGNPIVSDGLGGGIYMVDLRQQVLRTLVPPGTFRPPANAGGRP